MLRECLYDTIILGHFLGIEYITNLVSMPLQVLLSEKLRSMEHFMDVQYSLLFSQLSDGSCRIERTWSNRRR
ncbi:hypothetical protein Scep_019826 [Stephania cephalantha]|uniref:Uncharacterized protein n=1 Tax=Stephania cephalantha TaxID=152367 RepID=A0AAP0IC06_9MAGN